MERRPSKRRLTWFGKNHPASPPVSNTPSTPNTLGKMWQREPRGSNLPEETNSWLTRERPPSDESSLRRTGWEPLPKLPTWPPLPEQDPSAMSRASEETYGWLGGVDISNEHTDHAMTARGQSSSRQDHFYGGRHEGRLRALWRRFVPALVTQYRRPRLALVLVAIGATVLVVCSVLSITALGNAFLQHAPTGAHGTPGAGNLNGVVATPSVGRATPNATTTAAAVVVTPPPPVPLTLAFTCANGAVGDIGQVCVHTLPHAVVSLTVRYCDNTYAKGKAFHGVNYADGSGNYTWRWNVTTTCSGTTTATVTAKSAGQTLTQSTTFTISR